MAQEMTADEYNKKLRDPRWQRKRLEIFQRDDWTCQLCCRTDLELHIHHLYRTNEDPWAEPDLHLLTVCKLCHEQQPGNPRGGFKHPKRLYKTDAEWWKEHGFEYEARIQEKLAIENVQGYSIREIQEKVRRIRDGIHALRLVWEEKRKGE